jgi:polar amino acid transport system permease protein
MNEVSTGTQQLVTTVSQPPARAVPLRHPLRWVATATVAVLALMFLHMLVTNKSLRWGFMWRNATSPVVLHGAWTSIELTIYAMALGIVLGVVLAAFRLSRNPIVAGAAWLYIWFFRAVPRLVLAVLFGNLGILYARFEFGVPFDRQIGRMLGVDIDGRMFGFDSRTVLAGFFAGLLALGLSEAAYVAEIVRTGIRAVDRGQSEAAAALAIPRVQALRRIVLPQAMRVVVPSLGSQTITMLKDTSIVAYVPLAELFFQLSAAGSRTFQVFPMYVAACLWYLILTSVLLAAQRIVERRFAHRGGGPRPDRRSRHVISEAFRTPVRRWRPTGTEARHV